MSVRARQRFSCRKRPGIRFSVLVGMVYLGSTASDIS